MRISIYNFRIFAVWTLIFIFVSLPAWSANLTGESGEKLGQLSFADAYQKILELSTRIAIQKENIEIAKAQTLKPFGQLLPKMSFVAKDLRSGEPYLAQQQASLEVSMNLFRFGADSLALKSSSLNTKSQDEELAVAKLESEDTALSAIFAVIRYATSLDVYRVVSKNRQELLRIAEERYQKGLLALQEVQKISVDFENSKARETDAANLLHDAEGELEALLASHWLEKMWPWSDVIKAKAKTLEQELKEFKLENSPQYRSAVFAEESSRANLNAKWRSLFPSIDLTFSTGNSDLSRGPTTYYAGAVILTIPIFDQFREYSDYRQAVGFSRQASAQRLFLAHDLSPLFEAAKKKFQNSLESSLLREKNLSVSRKLYDDNFARFKQGRVSVNDLLIDQNRLSDAELLAIEGWHDLHLSYEKFCHAAGMNVDVHGNCQGLSTESSSVF